MLTSKWHTLNHNCQKFNAISKPCEHLGKSEENELDVRKRARMTSREENKGKSFAQEDVWEILKLHSKWDGPEPVIPVDPVNLTGGEQAPEGGHEELFSKDPRPRPPWQIPSRQKSKSETTKSIRGSNSSNPLGNMMSTEFRLKREGAKPSAYEVAKEKDRKVMRLEEMKFLSISTKDLSEDDAYWINVQKKQIKDKYNLHRD
ncbi:hypothetical protein Tco_1121832 [Tanacetum coccineum]|uniref:No apical meristem-associated C-terminal domain-containing protein n=1 Tax=Tanacetum coccineum TaxID=301880 RepID=A0ABQ5J129_9ASTR